MVMLLQPQLYRRVDMGDWKSKVYIGVAFVGVRSSIIRQSLEDFISRT